MFAIRSWPVRGLLCAALLAPCVLGQSPFVTTVVAYDDMGQAGGGYFVPIAMVGAPDGLANSLGIGGWATLGFGVVIADGPGADLIVSENPFYSGGLGQTFAEVMYVEVSSNGTDFARVPSRYRGPAVSPGAYGVINAGAYEGLPGAIPVRVGAVDPQDVVQAGGDAIDLADLSGDPLVTSGKVDLSAIHYVRLVDVRDGIDKDSVGTVIHDPGNGSADVDGVTVIHHQGNLSTHGPTVDVTVPANGAFEISVDDPDGVGDLDPASLRLALWGIEVPFTALLPAMNITRYAPTGFTVKLATPLPPGFLIRVAASVKDRAGHRSGDSR